MTLQHRYAFGSAVAFGDRGLSSPTDWDAVRANEPGFAFPLDREAWRQAAERSPSLLLRAELIAEILQRWGTTSAVSVGVGTGLLEYLLLRRLPDLQLRCGDFADQSLDALRSRFTECKSIERMDLADADWYRDPDEVVILNRVDMELSADQWHATFSSLATRGAKKLVWVPCGLLSLKALVREAQTIVGATISRRPASHAGYLRSRTAMIDLFALHYQLERSIPSGDLPIWTLLLRT